MRKVDSLYWVLIYFNSENANLLQVVIGQGFKEFTWMIKGRVALGYCKYGKKLVHL